MSLKETPAKFYENTYVTRNKIALHKTYLTKECEWSEPQIDQVLDPVHKCSGDTCCQGKIPIHSQHFMKTQKPFPFARKTDRCVAIPDQLKNILYGLKLSSNLAKHLKDVYEKGIIPIQDEEAGEVKM